MRVRLDIYVIFSLLPLDRWWLDLCVAMLCVCLVVLYFALTQPPRRDPLSMGSSRTFDFAFVRLWALSSVCGPSGPAPSAYGLYLAPGLLGPIAYGVILLYG